MSCKRPREIRRCRTVDMLPIVFTGLQVIGISGQRFPNIVKKKQLGCGTRALNRLRERGYRVTVSVFPRMHTYRHRERAQASTRENNSNNLYFWNGQRNTRISFFAFCNGQRNTRISFFLYFHDNGRNADSEKPRTRFV